MSILTKEELDRYESRPDDTVPLVPRYVFLELIRGYRAMLAEVEHHKTACELMAESYAHELAELPTDEESQEIDELYHYHRNRLAALKGEG